MSPRISKDANTCSKNTTVIDLRNGSGGWVYGPHQWIVVSHAPIKLMCQFCKKIE